MVMQLQVDLVKRKQNYLIKEMGNIIIVSQVPRSILEGSCNIFSSGTRHKCYSVSTDTLKTLVYQKVAAQISFKSSSTGVA